jgi:hypothetical protein
MTTINVLSMVSLLLGFPFLSCLVYPAEAWEVNSAGQPSLMWV